jgi:hypothetical protein
VAWWSRPFVRTIFTVAALDVLDQFFNSTPNGLIVVFRQDIRHHWQSGVPPKGYREGR